MLDSEEARKTAASICRSFSHFYQEIMSVVFVAILAHLALVKAVTVVRGAVKLLTQSSSYPSNNYCEKIWSTACVIGATLVVATAEDDEGRGAVLMIVFFYIWTQVLVLFEGYIALEADPLVDFKLDTDFLLAVILWASIPMFVGGLQHFSSFID